MPLTIEKGAKLSPMRAWFMFSLQSDSSSELTAPLKRPLF